MEHSHYRLIGRGPSSTVYLAIDRGTGRWLAVKVLDDVPPDEWERAATDSIAVARLSDRAAIVPILSTGTTASGAPYFTMPCAERGSLADVLEADRLTPAEAVGVAEPVAMALAHLHAHGLVHGAVHPRNLLVGAGGDIRLADVATGRISRVPSRWTTALLERHAHVAPEVLRGEEATPRSDVYSLASTLYAAIEGVPPFRRRGSATLVATVERKLSSAPPEPTVAIEPALAALLMQALDPDPAARPSAGEFLERLGDHDLAPLPVTAAAGFGDAEEVADPVGADLFAPDPGAATDAAVGEEVTPPAAMVADDTGAHPYRFALLIAAFTVLIGVIGAIALSGGGGDGDELAAASSRPGDPVTTVPLVTLATAAAATAATATQESTSTAATTPSSPVTTPSSAPTTTPTTVSATTVPVPTTTRAARPSTSVGTVPPAATSPATTRAPEPTVTVGPPPTPAPTTPDPTTTVVLPPPPPPPPTTPAPTTPPPTPPVAGGLTVSTSSNGVRVTAGSADRCANSHWVLSGPVSYDQASTAPPGCFPTAHAFDSTWYRLTLTPGDYRISLTVTRNGLSSSTSAGFTIAG